jgi:hypothetical protein
LRSEEVLAAIQPSKRVFFAVIHWKRQLVEPGYGGSIFVAIVLAVVAR